MGGQSVRQPAVAGSFYPGDAAQLRAMVRSLLAQAPPPQADPEAMVTPHAGYIYSGYTAACGYRALAPVAPEQPRRVLLVGPSHRVYLEGMSVGPYDAFATPLGRVPVDAELCARLAQEPDVSREPLPHAQEHSLEVHLPFLQETLGNFRLVPLVYGRVSGARLAELLDKYRQEGDLVVISSDLSHFYTYEQAQRLDAQCHRAVLARDTAAMAQCEACGGVGMKALLTLAVRHRWQSSLVDYRNSGDTAGDKSRVVGYASYLFHRLQAA